MFRRSRRPGNDAPSEVGSAGPRYRLVQRLASSSDEFVVHDDLGRRAFVVVGKKHGIRAGLILRDLKGAGLCQVRPRVVEDRDSMEIEALNGQPIAVVKRTQITPLRDRFTVTIGHNDAVVVAGNIIAHEYRIGDIATVSKRWFRTRDSYGVEVSPGEDVAPILAATICIDLMTSELN